MKMRWPEFFGMIALYMVIGFLTSRLIFDRPVESSLMSQFDIFWGALMLFVYVKHIRED